jgi:hypothetical protein
MHPMVAARGVLAAMQRTWKSRAPTKQEKKLLLQLEKYFFTLFVSDFARE